MRKQLLLLALLAIACRGMAQKPPETEKEFEEAYEWRIKQEMLNNVYIPKDLTDAFIQLNKLIDAESQAKFKNVPEEEAAQKLFFSLGRWITLNWGFYGGSRLSHFIKNLGIYHPEDMARFIIISYHRNLNRVPLNVKEQVKYYQEKQAAEQAERLKKGEVLHKETIKKQNAVKGKTPAPPATPKKQ